SSIINEESLIKSVGDGIWRSDNAGQAAIVETYLDNTINYYRRIQQADNEINVDQIISAYEAVIL
ncbi:MAG: hypothetical protein ACI88H_000336, partial [Cocleimonas sp.]